MYGIHEKKIQYQTGSQMHVGSIMNVNECDDTDCELEKEEGVQSMQLINSEFVRLQDSVSTLTEVKVRMKCSK
jgi:hypothetical protein